MGALAHFWGKQSDAGRTHAYDPHTLFLAAEKTGSSSADSHDIYYGHYLHFTDLKSTGILYSGE